MIIVITPQGVAHILSPEEHLMFIRVRIGEDGSIRRIDNIYRPIKVEDKIMKKIQQIDNSMAREG